MKTENRLFIVLLAVIMVITLVCGYFAFREEEVNIKTDGIKIKEEYASMNGVVVESTKQEYPEVNLSDDNPYVYRTEEEIVKILSDQSGIIYFGFKECPWCRTMLPVLEEAAKEEGISEVYYLDIRNIRDTLELDENDKIVTTTEGTENYYKILELMDEQLDDYTLTSKDGKVISTNEKRLYAPTVVVVKNGEILNVHVGTVDSQESGFDALSDEEKSELKSIYVNMMKQLKEGTCTEGC